jgi:outer membrane lipopolysaccharide assembly protein LptE/RlpB
MKKIILLCLALLLPVAVSACGYSFRHNQSNLPPDIKTIAIPMFANRTNQVRLEAVITEQLRYQFSQSQILKIVPMDEADVILSGVITSISSDDVTLTSRSSSEFHRLSIAITAVLTRRDNGQALYNGGTAQTRNYTVSANDAISSQAARMEALRLVARDTAQSIHDGVLQNF